MDEIIHKLSGPQLIGLVAITVGTAAVLVLSLAGMYSSHWAKIKEVEAETQLKRDLVAAGFTADEIERVVQATSKGQRPGVAERRERSADRVCG